MRFEVMTLFPELVDSILSSSVIGRAREAGHIEVNTYNIRDYSTDKHRKTDDTTFGGGVGMVMTCQPIYDCYLDVKSRIGEGKTRVIYMSPKGRIFSHEVAKELREYDNLVFLCGHYEGVDQRVIDEIVDEEISIGDYVVTGGEVPACIVIDAVSRLVDGVLSSEECYEGESLASGILEYPQYTKPRVFMGREVPEVLLSGDHKKIDMWRLSESVRITKERRPELLKLHPEFEEALKPKAKKGRKGEI
jgi:tRNA (guanine37-N1)-methyltransferase